MRSGYSKSSRHVVDGRMLFSHCSMAGLTTITSISTWSFAFSISMISFEVVHKTSSRHRLTGTFPKNKTLLHVSRCGKLSDRSRKDWSLSTRRVKFIEISNHKMVGPCLSQSLMDSLAFRQGCDVESGRLRVCYPRIIPRSEHVIPWPRNGWLSRPRACFHRCP
jgi:hypothetical protein